jgi:Protein of unknown function (DUF3107)
MEVRIGVLHTPKEIELDVDGKPEDIAKALDRALEKEDAVLWLTDTKGRRIGVPGERIAYVEIEGDHDTKRVGFGPS